MSAAEIINELPKLTEAQLRSVRQRLLELAAHHQEIELCNQAALNGAAILDRTEEATPVVNAGEVWIFVRFPGEKWCA